MVTLASIFKIVQGFRSGPLYRLGHTGSFSNSRLHLRGLENSEYAPAMNLLHLIKHPH